MSSGGKAAESNPFLDALVHSYLTKKGFTAAASQLEREPGWNNLAPAELARLGELETSAMEKSLALKIRLFNGTENYASAYKALRDWVHGSLDIYKVSASARGPPSPPAIS